MKTCWSCDKTPTHASPDGIVKVCDTHLRTLVGTSSYIPLNRTIPPEVQR